MLQELSHCSSAARDWVKAASHKGPCSSRGLRSGQDGDREPQDQQLGKLQAKEHSNTNGKGGAYNCYCLPCHAPGSAVGCLVQ